MNTLLEKLAQIARPVLVGGCVRDEVMGIESKDIDVEVFGISVEDLRSFFVTEGISFDEVGKSFGVFKVAVDGEDYDFSVPRRENKVGVGHKDFDVAVDSTMSIKEAASRRDFTFNAMAKDPFTGEIFDSFGGIEDIENGVIRHTGTHFYEDPLRVLRGFQFAGRFGFDVVDDTADVCMSIVDQYSTIPKERVWAEWAKWAEKSTVPSKGLEFLVRTGWVRHFPEIGNLIGLEQEVSHHPEGDVFEHTKCTVDAAARICDRDGIHGIKRLHIMFGALCHDFGKVSTTEVRDGKITSWDHHNAGVDPTVSFLSSIGAPGSVIRCVVDLVREHMVHVFGKVTCRTVRRLLVRIENASFDSLVRVIESDYSGRPPLDGGLPESVKMMVSIYETERDKVVPIVMGRHLIDIGMEPCKSFGTILKAAFDAQIDGVFEDIAGGIDFVRKIAHSVEVTDNA